MTPREQGFLLLTSQLGDPQRRPLTAAQFRTLAQRARGMEKPTVLRELTQKDLVRLGCGGELAQRILGLLEQQELLEHYLRRGSRAGCVPLTRVTGEYPAAVLNRLGLDAPGCLWAKGERSLLEKPAVALVGSRDLCPENEAFAREVGRQAARQGFVLVSGNARGADRAAQESCLAAGGQVICVAADELERHRPEPGTLYLSEEGFDLAFSTPRALSRNRVIHCMGLRTFVAQCGYQRGGTWDGTARNLRFGWSPVYCFDDGSNGAELLAQMGAELIKMEELHNISGLPIRFFGIFDQ